MLHALSEAEEQDTLAEILNQGSGDDPKGPPDNQPKPGPPDNQPKPGPPDNQPKPGPPDNQPR